MPNFGQNYLSIISPDHFLVLFQNFKFLTFYIFLALLDYVSRAHEVAICPSPVVRPSMSQLSLNFMHGFLSNLSCGFPCIFGKKMFFLFIFLGIFFIFVNMGPYGRQDFKTVLLLQITAESFEAYNDFPNGPHKNTFGIFENWNFNELYSFSLTWDPMGVKISTRYSSYKSQLKVFKLLLNFLPNGPHKITFEIFEILKIEMLMIFFFVFHNMGPYEY